MRSSAVGQRTVQDEGGKCFYIGVYTFHLLASLFGILLNEHQVARAAFLALFMLGLAMLIYLKLPSAPLNRAAKIFAELFFILPLFYFFLPITAKFALVLFWILFILSVILAFGSLFGVCT